jgi:hypothetical protein
MAVIWESEVKNSLKASKYLHFIVRTYYVTYVLESYKNKYIQPIQYCTTVENIHN